VTATEIILAVAMLCLMVVVCGLALQNRAIAREVRSEGRETRSNLEQSVDRIAQVQAAELQALREQMQGRPQAAVQTLQAAEAIPKAHRHVWRYASEEQTNGERVRFYTCLVPGCRDVQRVGAGDPTPDESPSMEDG
jgi:hypothetical protein